MKILLILSFVSLLIPLSAHTQEKFNTNSTSLESAQKVTRSPWAMSYFNITSSGLNIANYNTPSLSVYQYFALNYRLDSESKFSIRFPFTIVTPGVAYSSGEIKSVTSYPNDFHMAYSHYDWVKWTEWNLSATLYLYLPTTEFSQNKKWLTRTAAWAILDTDLNADWNLSYNSKPEYYWNTQKSYRKESVKTYADGSSSTQVFPDANLLGKLDHYFTISRSFGKNLSLATDIGFIHEWYQDSQWTTNPLNTDLFKVAPNVNFRVHPALSFIFGIENKIDIRTPKKDFALFREEDMNYLLMTFWSVY